MIINETKNTYEDIKYMYRKAGKLPIIIFCRIFFVIAGLFMFAEAMNLIQKNMPYFAYVSSGAPMEMNGVFLIVFIVLMFLLGILFIILNFYYLKFSVYRAYKKTYSKWSARHMEFGEEAVEVSFEEGGVKSVTSIKYDLMESYERCNDALYIAIKMSDKKGNKYLCLHDDSYLSGSVDELISFLDSKI